jgi:tetratricopeptide (TPR) repeat protein
LDKVLIEAENAIRADDRPTAIQAYRKAILLDPSNFTLRLEAGVLLRDAGGWEEAVATLDEAVRLEPSSAAAWRELGVALNKLHALGGDDRTGEDELRRAVEIDPRDFDAWSSLGGILKRKPDFPGALKAYERAVAESGGASYPLLNAMKLRAAKAGPLVINSRDQLLLRRAKRGRTLQTVQDPPYDTPWSFFDLAEICLYLGDVEGFRRAIDEGLLHSTHGWQAETFANSLELVSLMGEADDAVRDVIELLRATADVLS